MSKQPVYFQRIEGAVIFVGTTALYFALGGDWLKYLIFLALPDLSMAGYAVNPKIGAIIYNLFHNFAMPIAFIGIGILDQSLFLLATFGLVWLGHIGLDRAFGLGLKYPDSFYNTHLGRIGRLRKSA